jgi:hypothetical protein
MLRLLRSVLLPSRDKVDGVNDTVSSQECILTRRRHGDATLGSYFSSPLMEGSSCGSLL